MSITRYSLLLLLLMCPYIEANFLNDISSGTIFRTSVDTKHVENHVEKIVPSTAVLTGKSTVEEVKRNSKGILSKKITTNLEATLLSNYNDTDNISNNVWSDTSSLSNNNRSIIEDNTVKLSSNNIQQSKATLLSNYNDTSNNVWPDTSSLSNNNRSIIENNTNDIDTTNDSVSINNNEFNNQEDLQITHYYDSNYDTYNDNSNNVSLNNDTNNSVNVNQCINWPSNNPNNITAYDHLDGYQVNEDLHRVNNSNDCANIPNANSIDINQKSSIYTDGTDNNCNGIDFSNSLLSVNMLPYKSVDNLHFITPKIVKYLSLVDSDGQYLKEARYKIINVKEAISDISLINAQLDSFILALQRLKLATEKNRSSITKFEGCYQLDGYYPKNNSCFQLYKVMNKDEQYILNAYANAIISKKN